MTTFGETLRSFRQASNDPDRLNKRLTQERLGELIGHEMGDLGFSGAAISDWERGESKINAQDRNVLIALIQVLHRCGGIKALAEANHLLEAGNYRALSPGEAKDIFQEDLPVSSSSAEEIKNKAKSPVPIWSLFFESPQDFQIMLAKAQDGPPPFWPRVMVAVFRKFSDRFSASDVLIFVLWIWVWWLSWALIIPSLRWPFVNHEEALWAVILYSAGSIVIPTLIGAFTNTKDSEFWQKNKSVTGLNLRLYTYQGASVGFHVGYFFIFMIGLFGYNLGFTHALWLEFASMTIPVILGYASARLIPYNLFRAYERLSLRDGAIFFVFFLFGPAWGYFFLESYGILLTQALGTFVILLAITILLSLMTLRYRQSGTTIIPVYWWIIFFGFILLCQVIALFIK